MNGFISRTAACAICYISALSLEVLVLILKVSACRSEFRIFMIER